LSISNDKKDEERQIKKIKRSLSDNTRFKMERRKLLEEYPELMSGIPVEMRWNPRKNNIERANWEELSKSRKQLRRPMRRFKGFLFLSAFIISAVVLLYYVNSEIKYYLDKLFLYLQTLFK